MNDAPAAFEDGCAGHYMPSGCHGRCRWLPPSSSERARRVGLRPPPSRRPYWTCGAGAARRENVRVRRPLSLARRSGRRRKGAGGATGRRPQPNEPLAGALRAAGLRSRGSDAASTLRSTTCAALSPPAGTRPARAASGGAVAADKRRRTRKRRARARAPPPRRRSACGAPRGCGLPAARDHRLETVGRSAREPLRRASPGSGPAPDGMTRRARRLPRNCSRLHGGPGCASGVGVPAAPRQPVVRQCSPGAPPRKRRRRRAGHG